MGMTARTMFFTALSRASLVGALAAVATLVGPANAHKETETGWACAMCHPFAADTHPHTFPKFQAQIGKYAVLRDMINWCIEKPNQGEKIDPDSEAMKALEAYITWSNTGSVLIPGKH
jgi:thiosulfate dehydrogenase